MGIERHFLGWDRPMLPAAAQWLSDQFAQAHTWDLSAVTVVVPGRRAARRLLELLVQHAAGRTFFPPTLATLGSLPDRLVQPDTPVASELQSQLARVQVLRAASTTTLAALAGEPPEPGDLLAWWKLAGELGALGSELAAAGLRIGDIPRRAEEVGFDLRHLERFEALADIDQTCEASLEAAGLVDRQLARLQAVESRRCAAAGPIVLVATVDLPPLTRQMLRIVGETSPVASLVHAPSTDAEGFDDLGSMHVAYWRDRHVDIPDQAIHFVDRPADQAQQVVRLVAEQASATPDLAADHITVGLGDEAMAGLIRRTLALADVPARFGPGEPLVKSRPATLLDALGRFAAGRRLDDFASLLRHPDIEHHLARSCQHNGASEAWQTLLDTYATEHLQARLDGHWLGSSRRQAALKAVWDAVTALLPVDPADTRPLTRWSEPILQALRHVYGDEQVGRHDPDQHALAESLSALADALREQASVDDEAFGLPPMSVAQAVGITLDRLESARLPEIEGRSAVELVGYLELQLDDAPHLIVTAMNEGDVPARPHVDPLLPDSLRGKLGLTDSTRRFARDLMMLCAIIHSRPQVALIAGRRSTDGDPLAPSRLLLACDQDRLATRVADFYSDQSPPGAPMLLTPGDEDRFLIPPPLMEEPPLDRLSVTAFRDYIACPYRFYLKHVRRLEGIDDAAVEMDALVFGSLAHDVMQAFGESDCAESSDAGHVAAFLSDTLDQFVADRFGRDNRPAVRVQIEQLRQRLLALAPHQAALAQEGWRILSDRAEQRLETTLTIDDEPFTLVGRVDRIDHHPDLGYRILDYKTSNVGQKPERTHRRRIKGQPTWVDLQLPLYRTLCEPLGVCGQVEVGYINLPKKLAETGVAVAEWKQDDFDEAIAERDRIIRAIRARVFWPPEDPPTYPDDFVGLCADQSLERAHLITISKEDAP